VDKLFDSVNGGSIFPPVGKDLRCAVTRSSGHCTIWDEAICVLQSMEFVCKQNKVVSIKNWIQTIKGFKYLCKKLLDDGFDFILLRNFNQDPMKISFVLLEAMVLEI